MKAVVQKTVSVLPASHAINGVLQRHVTRGRRLTEQGLANKLRRTGDHLGGYEELSGGTPTSVLELGTGWFPVVPIAMALSGVERVHSVDVAAHVTPETMGIAARSVLAAAEDPPEGVRWAPERARTEALRRVVDAADGDPAVDEVADALGIDFIVGDAGRVELPDRSIDLIVSNNTLEHIPADGIRHILTRFRRLLRPDGVMSHFIDLSDHFAHLDRTISEYNFLRFSERRWRWIDNPIQPQNRMRCAHHRTLQEELGFRVVRTDPWPGDLEALRATPLHPDFCDLPEEEIAIPRCHMYSVAA